MSFSNKCSPVIFGCSGPTLTKEELTFFKDSQPLGFILFKRNIQDKSQLKMLIENLKSTLFQENPPILIDQEGGRVARLTSPHWFNPPASASLASAPLEEAKHRVHETYTRIAADLRDVGITVNCAPVLDLHTQGADPIMGDRTFSSDPQIVAELGSIAIQSLQEGGIIPVMKHIPGHGAATCDSHKVLPSIPLSEKELESHFLPFKANAQCPWAMTAHIVYTALDPYHPATQSSFVIHDIIRKRIGFQGFLISDDLGMGALQGSFGERTRRSLEAGCNAVLHCSGDLNEMIEVIKGIETCTSFPQKETI